MILEGLIIFTCTAGNSDACMNAANAYYKQEKLDIMIEYFKKNNKDLDKALTASGSIAVMIREKKLIAPFYMGNGYNFVINKDMETTLLIFKRDFP